MKKSWLLFASLSLAISMLSACNSTDESNGSESDKTTVADSGETTVDETADEDEAKEETKEPAPATETREPEKSLSYSINDEKKEETAKLTDSDEQNYSIYKLDGYSLTGEEPNKDSIYYDENSAVFMRVETISKDEADYEIIRDTMIESIAAVSIGKEPVKIDKQEKLPQGEGISNQIGYETTFELGTVSGMVFEQGNLIVRLTIFDQNSVNLTDAFLKMGETIAVKQ
ncbi:hypothetical protein MHH33_12485 [Paenisporosarcina sp. FSL H8-0542]|uniref:hypothetical protein n=1 Tax=Paenisporosarcina sp. FSL H8-0542 TaxID=2921401 RepID=UPI00315A9912